METKTPRELFKEAEIAEESGDLETAMRLYADSEMPQKSALIALRMEQPQRAFDYYLSAGDEWSAKQIALKHNIPFEMHEPKYVLNGNVPEYSGDFNLVKLASMGEVAISQAKDPFPIIGTFGLGPCVALATYNKADCVGSVSHFYQSMAIEESLQKINSKINGKLHDSDIYLIGGYTTQSENLIKKIKGFINTEKIIEEDVLGETDEKLSLSLDFENMESMVLKYDAGAGKYIPSHVFMPHKINSMPLGRNFLLDTRDGKTYVFNPNKCQSLKSRNPLEDGINSLQIMHNIYRQSEIAEKINIGENSLTFQKNLINVVYNGVKNPCKKL